MMNFLKRAISLVLAVLMFCGNAPQIVSAMMLEKTEHIHEETNLAEEEEILDSAKEENLWEGRSAVFVGDSITAGAGTDKIYYQYLKESIGFDSVTAMGVGGSCISAFSDYGETNQPLINRYQNIPSADLIMVFMGTNDYGHETPLGTIDDTEDGTFYGALNTIIPALVAKHTSSKIVFATSLHRYGAGTSGILGTKFTYDNIPNGVGATLEDYVNAVKTVCAENGVAVIDLFAECPIDPTDAAVREELIPDGIHPNAAGHEIIAGIMEEHILGYEPVEKEPLEETELIHGNKFTTGSASTNPNRASSRINYYLKAGTVITLKDPETFQWACAKTDGENSTKNLGYFPDSQWTDKVTATVEEDGWVGFTFKYRDETKSFDLSKSLSDFITIEEPHTHTYKNGICTGCGEAHPNLENYKGKVISILSASTSTFAGYIPVADGFNLEHRARYPQDNLLTDVNETWWMQVINSLDAKLGINESWAGSQVLNTQDVNSGDLGPDAAMASVTRIKNLGANGTPDMIFFFGAGNDMGRGVELGTFDPETAPTEVELNATKWNSLADAYVAAIMRLQYFYPDSEIVVMTTYAMPSYVTAAKLNKYAPVLNAICDHYGVKYVDLRDSGVTFDMLPDNIHPNAEGMDHITSAVLEMILEEYDLESGENKVYSITHNLTNAKAEKHYYKGVSAGAEFEETVIGEELSVTVTMGGKDITAEVYKDGKIEIPSVTGEIVVTAKAKYDCDGHLQELPEELCAGTNLWTALEPENIYYTATGWGNTAAGTTWSITFPVKPGDRIRATSLGKYPENGSSANGVRVTWFDEDGVLATLDRETVYAEFAENGYITAPEGAAALNIPMTNNQEHYAVYILSAEHNYKGTSCSICKNEHPNLENYKGKVISILGDSISTFAGYIPVADGFNLEHLARYPQDNLLTDVNETWWMQVINELDAKLGINDSWRGSTVSGYVSVTTGVEGYKAAMSNPVQIQNLGSNGTLDVILFYGGTNDLAHVSKIGTFDPATAPTEAQFETLKWDNLADGYCNALLRLKYFYPDAEIIAMFPTYTKSYYTNDKLAQGNALLAEICEHYGVKYVDLRDCGISVSDLPDGIHPDAKGMDYITEAVIEILLDECETEAGENVVYSVTHNLDGAKASKSYYKGVSAGKSFEETVEGENLSVTVVMGGKDVTAEVYKDGKIEIPSVTGEIAVTAKGEKKPVYADYIEELPEKICSGLNLWGVLEHNSEYYTVSGWGTHASGTVYSVTFAVNAGDRIFATSFKKSGENGTAATNGIRVTFFGENDYVNSVSADKIYSEFAENGFITVPEGVTAVSIPMWNNSDENEIYLLDAEHDYKNGICGICGFGEKTEPLSLRYDDRYDVTGKTVEIVDAGKPTSYKVGYGVEEGTPDDAVIALSGDKLIATGIGTAKVRIDGVLYEITVEKAKIHIVTIMGQSNAGNHFENATSDVTCAPGTAYWWGNGNGVNATEPVDYTASSMGFHTPLVAELYAQSVTNGDSVKPVMVWQEGITSKNGQSIVKWASSETDTSGTDATAQMIKNCVAYYEQNSDKYEIVGNGIYWLQGESDTAMEPEKYTKLYMAMWSKLKEAGAEYVAFFRVRKGTTLNTEEHEDLGYTGSLTAQLQMINNNADMFMATTVTENWTGVETTEHSINISNYITLMEEYGKEGELNDSYGNASTFKDGVLTTTMKTLYGSNNKCHYGKFGYGIIGADAAFNMSRAFKAEDFAIVKADTSGKPENQQIFKAGEKAEIDITGMTENLAFRANCGSTAGTLGIKVTSGNTDITSKVIAKGVNTYGTVDTEILRDYEDVKITVTYNPVHGNSGSVEFEIVDNTPDVSETYIWDFEKDLLARNEEGEVVNGFGETALNGSYVLEDGKLKATNLQLAIEDTISLSERKNWSIEWKFGEVDENTRGFLLCNTAKSAIGTKTIYISPDRKISVSDYADSKGYRNYYTDESVFASENVVRITNKFNPETEESILSLWINGKPVIEDYQSKGNINKTSGTLIDMTGYPLSGDFEFNYLGCTGIEYFPVNGEIDYIRIVINEKTEPLSLRYDDRYDVTGKAVEIVDAGKPTSYKVGYGVEEGTPDDAVIALSGDKLIATGIGTAKVRIDGVLYEITVEAAPISLILLAGQSNMQGSEGNADQSIICHDGVVYSTYGDRYTMTVDNATNFAPSALAGEYSEINVNGTTDNIEDWPVYLLNEKGAGKIGPDSGFGYEWAKQTGEKVWVINAAHGGTSINVWQDGTTQFEECERLFKACSETMQKEIAAGHYTLSHMLYFWCQGCSDSSQTAEWYVKKYLSMHESFKTVLAFDHDSNEATEDYTFEFGGIIPVRAGNESYTSYRQGVYTDTTSAKYHESFKDLRFTGPRVAQYWLGNNPELEDIRVVCNVGEDWVWMPDGTNGVSDYFNAHYENGIVDYETQVAQKESWYAPTTPAAVHDSIHYNQIGYNEIGRESVRNALVMLGEIEKPEVETVVELLSWDGYTEVAEVTASANGNSGTLVVPKIYPLWEAKNVEFTLSEGLEWNYYDIITGKAVQDNPLSSDYYNAKKYVAVGDSITYGSLADPREENRYSTLLAEKLGAEEKNIGASSATFSDCRAYGKPFEFSRFTYDNIKGASLVTILLGTNDFNYAVKDGIWQGTEKTPAEGYERINVAELGEFGSDDITTIYGAAKMWCEEIVKYREMEEFKDTKFFFITPLQSAWNNSVTSKKDFDPEKENIHGYTLRDICNAIIETADYYEIPVIDLNKLGGIYWNSEEDETCSKYLASDKLHPNNDGHKLIAEELYGYIINNPEYSVVNGGTLSVKGEVGGTVNVVKSEPGAHYKEHLSTLPEKVCCGLNLWNILEHDDYYFESGAHWGIHSSGTVKSVTIPVSEGEKIFATSFGKAGENGSSSTSGIRTTFLSEYGIAKTMTPAECYAEFTANGGYLVAPEGTTAINIAMWNTSDENEIYLLDREHDASSETCSICGKSSHEHDWSDWEVTKEPSREGAGTEERKCSGCGETETREIEGVWQKYDLENHYSDLPEKVCCGLNLWNVLEHDKYFLSGGTNWGIHSSGKVYSVTFAVSGGDKIFATSFGKAGENGNTSANGIRVTFLDKYGVLKTLTPAETYAEFTANGRYIVAPEGAVAVNIPMWNNSDENEIYLLDAEHDYEEVITEPTCTEQGYTTYTCSVCGESYVDNYVSATGHTLSDWETVTEATATEPGKEERHCENCDYSETREIPAKGYPLGDINLDGEVNVMDAYYARLIAAKIYVPTEQQIALGDVDGDGKITAIDANIIRKFVAKIIASLPIEQ